MVPLQMSKRERQSELAFAAEGVETELEKFEELSERIRTATLDSQKNLERFANMLKDVADTDERLGEKVRTLVSAIAQARERQQKQAELISQRAQELQQRTSVFQGLIEQYANLGSQAAQLNLQVQEAYQARQSGTAEGEALATARLGDINEGAGKLAEEAERVMNAADQAGFNDISRQADSLRQQLLSARNKLNLLSKKVPSA